MSERTIYTCDNCGAEGETHNEFIELKLTRNLVVDDPQWIWNMAIYNNGVTLARGQFCAKCCEDLFGAELMTPKDSLVLPEQGFMQRVAKALAKFALGKSAPAEASS